VRYMEWNHRLDLAKTIRLEFVVGIFLILAASLLLASQNISFFESRYIIGGGAALLIVLELGVPFAIDQQLASDTAYNRGVKFAMLTYFTAVLVRSPRSMRWFMAAYIFSLFYLTQESFRGGLNGSMVWENQGIPRLHGSVPSVNHPNSLGSAILGIIPFIIFLYPQVKKFILRTWLLAITPMAAMVVLWSGSRTAYVGFIALLALWFVLSKHKKKIIVFFLFASMVLKPLVPQDFVDRFESITESGSEGGDGSKHERVFLNQLAWETFLANPAGIGVESFRYVSVHFLPYAMEVHCLYLQILSHVGIQGMMAFLFFVGATLSGLWRARISYGKQIAILVRRARADKPDRRILRQMRTHIDDLNFLIAVANATAAFIVNRLLIGIFSQDLYEIYWWFGAGVACSLIEMSATSHRFTISLANMSKQSGDDSAGANDDFEKLGVGSTHDKLT